jgi:hypothetical protein
MKNRLLSFATLSSLLVALLAWGVPVRAQSVDDRIRSLEAELSQLKAEQQQVKTEQMELKKAATEAQEKLPTFEYAPGDGMTIEAADKSWAFNVSYRLHIHMNNNVDGRAHFRGNDDGEFGEIASGVTNGELAPRRNRFNFLFCWDDCFYSIEHAMDYERAPRIANARDNEVAFHFEQWNPYLPMFSLGLRRGAGATHLGRSSTSDAKLEHNMIFGFGNWSGAGSHAGAGLFWNRVPVGPGDVSLAINYLSSQGGTHMEFIDSDRKGIRSFVGTRPFSKMKGAKWIQGLEFGVGLQAQATDRFVGEDHEIATHEERSSQTLFELDDAGSGWSYLVIPGMRWRIGPYMLRGNWHGVRTEGRDDGNRGIKGTGWNISNQIFLWSPKGFLTGSPSTAGSLLLGFDFERVDVECGLPGCSVAHDTVTAGNSVSRNTVLNREIGLWYWVRPGLSIGTWYHIWKAANTPVNTQVAVGCKSNIDSAEAGKGSGRSCEWWSWNLGMRLDW